MKLTLEEVRHFAGQYFTRRMLFPNEDELTSFIVVTINYGDHLTSVACIGGEWRGVKGDLHQENSSIPRCPLDHPLIESMEQTRLGLVKESVWDGR